MNLSHAQPWPGSSERARPDLSENPFHAVHWELRRGFCGALASLGGRPGATHRDLDRELGKLLQLMSASDMLDAAELEVLTQVPADHGALLANRDLRWGRSRPKELVAQIRSGAPDPERSELPALMQYVAVYTGEMLVQFHAKEVEAQEILHAHLSDDASQKLHDDLAGIASLLRRGAGER